MELLVSGNNLMGLGQSAESRAPNVTLPKCLNINEKAESRAPNLPFTIAPKY